MNPFITGSGECRKCFDCIGACPTGAAEAFHTADSSAPHNCLGDGACVAVCRRGRLGFTDRSHSVERLLQTSGIKIASLAPSYRHVHEDAPGRVIGALRRLGFSVVEETLTALPDLVAGRLKILRQSPDSRLIASSCPVVVNLVRQKFPHLAPVLEPVPSPMSLHAQSLKERYGWDTTVIFVGPCFAKRNETREAGGWADEVLTFVEMQKLCQRMGFDLEDAPDATADAHVDKRTAQALYRMDVAGLHECLGFLEQFPAGLAEGMVAEVLCCDGGCRNGPGMPPEVKGL